VEERGLAKGKTRQFPRSRTQSRGTLKRKLWRIRQVAKDRKGERFTALWHHIYSPDRLHEAYYQLRRESAPGVDGVTWKQYGEQLWGNLTDLAGRLARGAYKPSPVERTYIPKTDGRQRPIGKPVLEDKIVQRAYAAVLAGHYQYYGVPRNGRALGVFYIRVVWHWWRALRRRSHKHNLKWKRFAALARDRLPQPRITHPALPGSAPVRHYLRQEPSAAV